MVTEMSAQGQTNETEIKLRIANPAEGERLLLSDGFQISKPRIFESNTVFDREDLSLKALRSVLRLRQAGSTSILTFKGSPQPGRHKVREELETIVGDAAVCQLILNRVGFQKKFAYEKYRTEFRRLRENGVATVDETPIGSFLELEGEPAWIDARAHALGFQESDYLTASYGRLYLEFCEASGVTPGDMVFRRSTA